ncbi:MAG: hypothetical protein WBX11_02830 [Thiobacillaceae bacterium]|jgi:hypothetical protein
MSEIYIVWANDPNQAQARLEQISGDETPKVLRRGKFSLVQSEDLDAGKSLTSDTERYCIVFQLG